MISIGIKHNFEDTLKLLDSKVRKQIPFATSKTLNALAVSAQKEVIGAIKSKFDRPTAFTVNSTYIKYSNKKVLKASVNIKDRELLKSKPFAETLLHEFAGGTRIRKRLEFWLQRAGYISSNEFVAPGEGAKLDSNGNMSRGEIQKILSQLSAGPDAASFRSGSARSKAKRALAGYFWSRGGKLARGVWARFSFAQGGAVKPILIVISTPRYKQRIDMDAIGQKVVNRDFDAEFARQFALAVGSAR